MQSQEVEREEWWRSDNVYLLIQSRTPAHGTVSLIFKVDLSTTIKLYLETPSQIQRCVKDYSRTHPVDNINHHQPYPSQELHANIITGFVVSMFCFLSYKDSNLKRLFRSGTEFSSRNLQEERMGNYNQRKNLGTSRIKPAVSGDILTGTEILSTTCYKK